MAYTQSLLDNAQKGGVAQQADDAASLYQQILDLTPVWKDYGCNASTQDLLSHLEFGVSAVKQKMIMQGHPGSVQACMDALSLQEELPVRWVLTFLNDLLREDNSAFSMFEEAMKKNVDVTKPLMKVLATKSGDTFTCDKAAWLLSGIICNAAGHFTGSAVSELLDAASTTCSQFGFLETLANLLKADRFRNMVWGSPEHGDRIFNFDAKTPTAMLYKSIFCCWLVSFDESLAKDLKERHIVSRIKDIVATNRVEKIARISLTLLRNLIKFKDLSEEIVEANVLEIVQGLEYEKWRDAELYDDVRDMVALISHEVTEFSNFDRYERELQSGKLAWGFIHTSKFWAENVMKFEQNDFGALKRLAACLHSSDTVTLAVACHDIGEFVALHPLGKRKIAQLAIKDRVMELMGSTGDDMRDVRREALMCCQKIMLNKWHEMDKAK